MHTLTYRARPRDLAKTAYCDTSFILDLFAFSRPAQFASASTAARQRAEDAHAFYIWGRLQQIGFHISIFGIEEAYNKLLMGPVNMHLRNATTLRSWKELKTNDLPVFTRLMNQGRVALSTFDTFLRGSGLTLITVGTGSFARVPMREDRICRYARAVLEICDSEAMDAFHYALMRRCGFELAVASDRDWSAFPYGTLITAA